MASGEQVREASLCDTSKQNTFLESIYQQKLLTKFCDVVMKVCNREIHAHSNVLAATSPYFENFLSLDLPRLFSQRSPQIIEIQIDGSEPNFLYEEAVEDVINYIYTGMMKVKDYNVSQIYEISKIMQLETVMNFCEDFLQGKVESNTVQTVMGVNQAIMNESAVNTDISAIHFPPIPEMWSTWAKNSGKEPGLSAFSPKTKFNKMVSVSAQTTPIDLKRNFQNEIHSNMPIIHEIRLIEPVTGADIIARKRPLDNTPTTSDKTDKGHTKSMESHALNNSPLIKKAKFIQGKEESLPHPEVKRTTVVTRSGRTVVPSKKQSELFTSEDCQDIISSSPKSISGASTEKSENTIEALNENVLNIEIDQHVIDDSVITKEDKVDHIIVEQEHFIQESASHIEEETTKPSIESYKGVHQPEQSEEVITFEKQEQNVIISNVDEGDESIDLSEVCIAELDEDEVRETDTMAQNKVVQSLSELQVIEQIEDFNQDIDTPNSSLKKRGRPKKTPPENLPEKALKLDFGKNSKEYSCTECNYLTTKVREMSSHMKLHKMNQGVCFYCDEMIEDKEELIFHVKTHKGAAPFLCTDCGLTFKTRTMLNLHLPKHSDQKPYICEVCSMAFKWKHALKNHMVTHSNKREHLCDICGYSTAHKAQLKSHRLIHTGDTFKCHIAGCSFETTKKQNLKYHEITHTRERPHQCEICGQNFSLYKNMKRHMLLHFAEKGHRCKTCDFASTRFDKLKEHMLKQHGVGTPPERRVKVADMLATSNINITVQPDRFVSGAAQQTIVIEPTSEQQSGPSTSAATEVSTVIDTRAAVTLGKEDANSYAILHKLLHDTGSVIGGEHKVMLLEKDGTTQVLIHKIDESGNSVIEQSALIEAVNHSQIDPSTSQISDINTSQSSELISTQPLETVTSIMLTPEGGQVIGQGEQCGFISVEELAAKLGLPGNVDLTSLFKASGGVVAQSVEESSIVANAGEETTIVEIPNTSSLSFAATSGEGIFLNSSGVVELPIQVTKEEGDTVEYMEVMVQESGQQLATNIEGL